MGLSETEVTNAALVKLGQAPVSSLEEDSKEAIYAKAIMAAELGELLAEADWYCAYVTVPLVKLAEKPVNFEYAYALPTDCVKPVKIELDGYPFFLNNLTYDQSSKSRSSSFKIEKKKLLTNTESVVFGYVSRVNVSELDDTLTGVFVTKLALALSYSLTASNTNSQIHEAAYNRKLKIAKGKNAVLMQQFHEEVEAIRVRRG